MITKKVKSRTIMHHTTNSFKAHVKLPPQSKPAPTKRIADQNDTSYSFYLVAMKYINFSKI